MGFSLSRAMQGAAMGAAHAAGEIFDGMIAEERKTREADAAMQRQLDVATQLQTHADELTGAREVSRDALKEARATKEQEKVTARMGAYYTDAREKGLDPNKIEGLRHIASSALEKGDIGVYDKITDNIDKREKNLSDAENRRISASDVAVRRDALRQEREDSKNQFTLEKFNKLYSKIDDDFAVKVPDPNKDGAYIEDRSAVPSARSLAIDLFKNKVPPEQIMTQLNKAQDIMQSERGLDPKLSGLRALELGQKRLDDEVKAQASDKEFAKGIINKGADPTYQFSGQAPRFGLPQGGELPAPKTQPEQMNWTSTNSGFVPRSAR